MFCRCVPATRPGGSFGIGVNPLTSTEPLWYTLADLVASRLLTGRAPRLLRVRPV